MFCNRVSNKKLLLVSGISGDISYNENKNDVNKIFPVGLRELH